MAFEPEDNNLKRAIRQGFKENKDKEINVPKKAEHEKTKNYTFSIQPSKREKLNEVAESNGYTSASKFLNDLIEKM